MELETTMGYLVALAVPLWLVVEQAACWWRAEQAGRQVERSPRFDEPVPSPAAKANRVPAMKLVHPPKSA